MLLVEPDKPLAKIYQDAIKSAGYDVSVVSGSQSAINSASNVKPDVVVLEIQLIEHSGIEFLYEFRSYSDWQEVPILIHTNVPYFELRDGWPLLNQSLGVAMYKYKPDTVLDELIASIGELVATK